MSRIPQRGPPSSKSSLPLPGSSRGTRAPSPNKPTPPRSSISPATPTRVRTKSTPKPVRRTEPDEPPPTPKGPTSLREAIALKRAEAKKASSRSATASGAEDGGFAESEDGPIGGKAEDVDDAIEVGRRSLRETIDRARGTGNLNLSLRSLPCIPSALFDIHLGITARPLASVTEEPPLGQSTQRPGRSGTRDGPTWYDAQDLVVLKAGGNEIVEIQPEINLFGSLKVVDLHKNKLSSLPPTFTDLSFLTTLDLSHNQLTDLPTYFFAFPNLVTLNISHNQLTGLPFQAPFRDEAPRIRASLDGGVFGPPAPVRADRPLPALQTLDASFNKITEQLIDKDWPTSVNKIDLSSNPISAETGATSTASSLLRNLSTLERLVELRFEEADIGDSDLAHLQQTPGPGSAVQTPGFQKLRLLSFAKTRVSREAAERAFTRSDRDISFDWVANPSPLPSTMREGDDGRPLRILVGTQVVKEAWEIEAEKRVKGRRSAANLRAAASRDAVDAPPLPRATIKPPVEKEQWEIDAEKGLLTEAGRRRARAAAAASAPSPMQTATSPSGLPSNSLGPSLANSTYYSASTQTLTLPRSQPITRGHARAFSSVAAPLFSSSSSRADLSVPVPTFPLAVIASEPFAQSLRALILNNRRADTSFTLPPSYLNDSAPLLPRLEELDLDGCGLGDAVSVSSGDSPSPSSRTSQPTLTLLARLFPSLRTLSLSYNLLTSVSITPSTLSHLLLADPTADPPRRGLAHLRLQGNRISDLDGFEDIANNFKANRQVAGWKLEELDVRENEIGRLPAKIGLLPLDVLLVEGNTFRVPARRVWEREGTKGLLSWLRGRLDDE